MRDYSTLEVLVAAFGGLGYALSARALLLLAVIGAFVLGLQAMAAQTNAALEVFVAYAGLTVLPLCVLEFWRRQS